MDKKRRLELVKEAEVKERKRIKKENRRIQSVVALAILNPSIMCTTRSVYIYSH